LQRKKALVGIIFLLFVSFCLTLLKSSSREHTTWYVSLVGWDSVRYEREEGKEGRGGVGWGVQQEDHLYFWRGWRLWGVEIVGDIMERTCSLRVH
jgi:hypothetical protein